MSGALVGVCAFLAYSESGGADVARMILLPTLVADIAMNGAHASGGFFSQAVAISISVLTYGSVLWIGFEVFDRPRRPKPETTREK